jgi:alkanesulfonate monooxygenase
MTELKFHSFPPTNGGDGRHIVGGGHGTVVNGAGGRSASVPYLGQIAFSAEQLGCEAALTPAGAWCEDAWITTAMLSAVSERLKFLVAFPPGLLYPRLEEAYWFGEGVLPELARRGRWSHPNPPRSAAAAVPFGVTS